MGKKKKKVLGKKKNGDFNPIQNLKKIPVIC